MNSVHIPQARALDVGISHCAIFERHGRRSPSLGNVLPFSREIRRNSGKRLRISSFSFFYRFSTVFVFVDNAPMQRSLMSTLLLILCDSPHRFRSNLLVCGKWGKLRKHSSDKDETNPLESCRQKKGPGGRRLRLVNARYFLCHLLQHLARRLAAGVPDLVPAFGPPPIEADGRADGRGSPSISPCRRRAQKSCPERSFSGRRYAAWSVDFWYKGVVTRVKSASRKG